MKKAITFLFATFLVSFGSIAKSIPVPMWVTEVKSVFNEKEYLAQVGYGDNIESARLDTLKNISNYLETRIQTEGKLQRELIIGNDSSFSTTAIQSITVESDVKLSCTEYEYFYSKKEKRYYCVAYIDRVKYWNIVKPDIENKSNKFMLYYMQGNDFLNKSEPILAKKYYLLANLYANDFLTLFSVAQLIAGDLANSYKSIEEKVYKIPVAITNAETRILIYLEGNEDCTNSIETKIKEIFSEEKFHFSKTKLNVSHIMEIHIEDNAVISNEGTEYEIATIKPIFMLSIINSHTGEFIYTFNCEAEKGSAFNFDVAIKRGYDNLCNTLDRELLKDFKEKMYGE